MPVDVGSVGEVGRQLVDRLLSGTMIVFGIIVFACLIIAITYFVKYSLKFNIKVRVKSKMGTGTDGSPVYRIFYDKGAIMFKKSDKRSFFRIKSERVDLPTPPFEVRQFLDKGGSEIVVRKESDMQYFYETPGKVEKKEIIDPKTGKVHTVDFQNVKVIGSGDAYWNVLRKRDNRKLFDVEGLLGKLAPIIGMVLMFMLVIFLTYLITDKWGAFTNAANALRDAAEVLRDVSTAGVTTG